MKYKYFETATVSIVNELKKLFANFSYVSNEKRFQDFPVYIQTSGDEAYLQVHSNQLVKRTKSDKIILPALVLKLSGITITEDNMTNQANGSLVIKNLGVEQEYYGEVTYYPCEMRLDGTLLFTDVFQYLSFTEYLMNGVYKNTPFKFEYMGKKQEGIITTETTDHEIDFSETSGWGDINEGSSHSEKISFNCKVSYPSFNLNDSLTSDVDANGDGNSEGGVGVPKHLMPKGNVIKGVIIYGNENNKDNLVTKCVTGIYPDEKQRKI